MIHGQCSHNLTFLKRIMLRGAELAPHTDEKSGDGICASDCLMQ